MKDTETAIITGGAGHLGRAIAELLAARGVRVAILDKNIEAGEDYAKDLSKRTNAEHVFIEANLSEPENFSALKNKIAQELGSLDYVVNNAAFYDSVPGWGVPFEKESVEAWQKVMQVNLLAPFFLVQSLYPLLKKSSRASVVNIGSIYGVVGPNHALYEGTQMTNPAAYAASKGGLAQTTQWLATSLAPDVRVNMVSPGGIARGQNDQFVERYKKLTPLSRMAQESDVAGTVGLLLSDAGSYITGQNIMVDGGWTAW